MFGTIFLILIAWLVAMPLWLSILITVVEGLVLISNIASAYYKEKLKSDFEKLIKKEDLSKDKIEYLTKK